jgi:hypothetical protein
MTEKSSTVLRVAGIGAGLAGAWLVHKVVDAVWRGTVGHPPPAADDEESSLAEVVLATALTGALVALVRLLAARGARRASGRLHQE